MERLTPGATEPSERAVILRLWREGDGTAAVWRCSVEDLRTRQKRGFSSLAELFRFLDLLTHDSESALLGASRNPAANIPSGARKR